MLDYSLINQIKSMDIDNIEATLFNSIVDDNTMEFCTFIKHCCATNPEFEVKSLNPFLSSVQVDINHIMNKKLFSYNEEQLPLIVIAAMKNNIGITQTLLKYGVCNYIIYLFVHKHVCFLCIYY